MQHRRDQALVIHVHVSEDLGHGQGVRDVGLTAAPALAKVRLLCVEVGALNVVGLFGVEVGLERGAEGLYGMHCCHWPQAPGLPRRFHCW